MTVPLRFGFESVGDRDGRYVVHQFQVILQLGDETVDYMELFALDTGAAKTMLRRAALERTAITPLDELQLPQAKLTGFCGETTSPLVANVALRSGSFVHTLDSVAVSREIDVQPFSLLGTDFLQGFRLSFDPMEQHALLIPTQEVSEDEVSADFADVAVRQAVSLLFEEDRTLIDLDVGERTITQHLAKHLQRFFPGWSVDCEYNRVGGVEEHVYKKVTETRSERVDGEEPGERSVFPDVIVHLRGASAANLIIIELKKTGKPGADGDREKLRLYMHDLGYRYAYFVSIQTGPNAALTGHEVEGIHD